MPVFPKQAQNNILARKNFEKVEKNHEKFISLNFVKDQKKVKPV
jgi:hypothetical protein